MLSDNPFNDFDTLEPVNINDGWIISTPTAENINSTELNEIIGDLHNNRKLWQMRSLLVFRNDRLVAETYLKDDNDRSNPRAIWSCTKQIISLLTGVALDQGLLFSVNDPISDYLASELVNHSDKNAITIEDLLTMRSGIGFDETDDASNLIQKKASNTIDYILSLPLINSPGQSYHYNSGDPHLIAASIQNEAAISLEQWADTNLFTALEFENYNWLQYDGYNFGGWGISTTPREIAKIAHLVLNGGVWKAQQLVSSAWIASMTQTQVSENTGDTGSFGYLWGILDKGSVEYPYMAGSGGQYAVVVPHKNMVIVTMSEHDTDGNMELDFYDFMDIVDNIVDISL